MREQFEIEGDEPFDPVDEAVCVGSDAVRAPMLFRASALIATSRAPVRVHPGRQAEEEGA